MLRRMATESEDIGKALKTVIDKINCAAQRRPKVLSLCTNCLFLKSHKFLLKNRRENVITIIILVGGVPIFAWRDSVKQLKRNEDFSSICGVFPSICGVSL